jgi:uncharacterized protein YbjT (DUF2867 family)
VVIDLVNAPTRDTTSVLEFFETSGRNLLAAEAAAGVQHHVVLSIVGIDRVREQGYYRAKVAQERLIETSGIPYTIIRSTQFLEFLGRIVDANTDRRVVRLPPSLLQPIAADDVAAVVSDVALASPRNGIIEIAGPERASFNEIIARYLKAIGDPREVVTSAEARYFGGQLEERRSYPWARLVSAASISRSGYATRENDPDQAAADRASGPGQCTRISSNRAHDVRRITTMWLRLYNQEPLHVLGRVPYSFLSRPTRTVLLGARHRVHVKDRKIRSMRNREVCCRRGLRHGERTSEVATEVHACGHLWQVPFEGLRKRHTTA